LNINEAAADTIMEMTLIYLMIGSYSLLYFLWRQPMKRTDG
jgi:hypothetical protein